MKGDPQQFFSRGEGGGVLPFSQFLYIEHGNRRKIGGMEEIKEEEVTDAIWALDLDKDSGRMASP